MLYALINSIMIIALYSLISRSIAPVNLLIYPILVYFSIVLFVGRLFTSMIVAKIVHLRHLKSEKLASKE